MSGKQPHRLYPTKIHEHRPTPLLRCGKPGPILAPNAYARKASLHTSACSDKFKEKRVSDSEGEIVLFPHFSNIFTGHHYTLCALFTHHQHNHCPLHSSDPFHSTDPLTKPSDILHASKLFPPHSYPLSTSFKPLYCCNLVMYKSLLVTSQSIILLFLSLSLCAQSHMIPLKGPLESPTLPFCSYLKALQGPRPLLPMNRQLGPLAPDRP